MSPLFQLPEGVNAEFLVYPGVHSVSGGELGRRSYRVWAVCRSFILSTFLRQ